MEETEKKGEREGKKKMNCLKDFPLRIFDEETFWLHVAQKG